MRENRISLPHRNQLNVRLKMETEFNQLTILSGVRQPYNIVVISLSKYLVKNIMTSDFLHIAQP